MRVVHWFPNFSAGGGVANSVFALAAAEAAAGAAVTVVTLPHERAIYGELVSDAPVELATWSGTALGRGSMRIHIPSRSTIQRLRTLQPEVVHIHAEFNPDNWWPPRIWSCPSVLSPHGAFHPAVLQRTGRRKAAYVAAARRALYERVAFVHALNPSEEDGTRRLLPSVNTYVVAQGPSPAVALLVEAEGRDIRGDIRPPGPVRLLYLGRLDVEPKGLDILLEGFAKTFRDRDGLPPATLTLVGPDARGGAERLAGLARRLDIGTAVRIREQVPQSEIPSLLHDCDIYVQLSRNEGSPLSLNDALVMGRPAIVSDRVGTVSDERIASLEHVHVVEPTPEAAAAAMAEVARDIDRLRGLADAALPHLREILSWQGAAACHLELYSTLRKCS
jgi:glycosyltransferase involved in cell wall biosynthesis